MNIDKLLKPYSDGGFESQPVKRTVGTIVDYLVNKKGYPLEIVGGAIFIVLNYLNTGGEFKGDGSYGSKGKELVTSIRLKCDELLKQRLEGATYQAFVEYYGEHLLLLVVPLWQRKLINWWHGRKIYDVPS